MHMFQQSSHVVVMPLVQSLAIFSPGSLHHSKWSCCEERKKNGEISKLWHGTPFSTSLHSTANRKNKQTTTCWAELNQAKSHLSFFENTTQTFGNKSLSSLRYRRQTQWGKKGPIELFSMCTFTDSALLAVGSRNVTNHRHHQPQHTYSPQLSSLCLQEQTSCNVSFYTRSAFFFHSPFKKEQDSSLTFYHVSEKTKMFYITVNLCFQNQAPQIK